MSQWESCPVTVRNVTLLHVSSRQRGSERDAEQPLHQRSTGAGIKLPSQSAAVVPFFFFFCNTITWLPRYGLLHGIYGSHADETYEK